MSSFNCMPAFMAATEYLPKENQTIMKKETRITAPDGCEIEKVEIVDGAAVVTFREKERKLPKSWEEFCRMYPIKKDECYIYEDGKIYDRLAGDVRELVADTSTLPDHATAEAVLALSQLIQLRNCYNGDWVPDWKDCNEEKYTIEFNEGRICPFERQIISSSPLYFKTEELRDEFLRYFRPLVEKLKPLYGIKEGGEE